MLEEINLNFNYTDDMIKDINQSICYKLYEYSVKLIIFIIILQNA